jgi:hypothetical protein
VTCGKVSAGISVSSTNKAYHTDINEVFLTVALTHNNPNQNVPLQSSGFKYVDL